MKKTIKWILIITVASAVLGAIVSMFTSDESKALSEVDSKVEMIAGIDSKSKLEAVLNELDSIKKNTEFESVKILVDSILTQKDSYFTIVESNFERNLKPEAYSAAKLYIKERLKSPSTAKFSPMSESTLFKDENGVYNIAMTVDAQNSFGAMIRDEYFIQIVVIGGKVAAIGGMD